MKKSFFNIFILSLLFLAGCYKLEKDLNETISFTTFNNKTTIFGLQLKLASVIPEIFRAKTSLQDSEPFHAKYSLNGEIIEFKKQIIRRDSKGEPTHQQVVVTVTWEITQGKTSLGKFTTTNVDHHLNSGIYNITKTESENQALNNALTDLASIMADKTEIAIRFKENN